MNFISADYAIFLTTTFLIYWFILKNKLRYQNLFLLIVSYLFYGWWDWRFLLLIALSTSLDYSLGIIIAKQDTKKSQKIWLLTSILLNIGFLAWFKYYNFFIDSLNSVLAVTEHNFRFNILNIILPVGISFYTFQSLSYTIDIYRNKLEPTTDFIKYAAYVSFFPQLVAGPIERATHLLPQFASNRTFNLELATQGMRMILWGLFKKMVVADNCAEISNVIFQSYESQSGLVLIIGAVAFSFQIYGDFSGYTDIAIGSARLLAFDLMNNFKQPYFSQNIVEFWRKWHISLTSWFRDYVYYPLGGNRTSKLKLIRNIIVVFLISGLWHGANFTYIVWGLYHAILYILYTSIFGKKRIIENQKETGLQSIEKAFSVFFTFGVVALGWVIFRSATITDAYMYLEATLTPTNHFFDLNALNGSLALSNFTLLFAVISIIILIVFERIQRLKATVFDNNNSLVRWSLYLIIMSLIYIGKGGSSDFIYFQF